MSKQIISILLVIIFIFAGCTPSEREALIEEGYNNGYHDGYHEGEDDAQRQAEKDISSAYESGYAEGETAGYESGYADGKAKRKAAVSSSSPDYPSVSYTYVINTNTGKFHTSGCRYVGTIKTSNRVDSNLSRDEIVNSGYVPCKVCKP